MKKIHIATQEGQYEYEELQLRSLWSEGKIPEDAKYWMEGMPDWRSILDLFPKQPSPAAAPVNENPYATPVAESGLAYPIHATPEAAGNRFVVVMLWLSLLAEVITLMGDTAQYLLLSRPYTEAEGLANDQRQQLSGILYLVIYLITAISFLNWKFRANRTCRALGASRMRFTPGWAAGWYFVPFMNLVRPYQVMKEIWKASHDPVHWESRQGSPLLVCWWTLWLTSGTLAQLSFRMSLRAKTIEDLKVITGLSIADSLTGIAACLAALTVIRRITDKQQEFINSQATRM